MTIDYVIKKKAIDLHLQGGGRNEIARILNSQKMRISEATITHLIQDWKNQHPQQQQQPHNNLKPKAITASAPTPTLNAGTSQPLPELPQQQTSSQSHQQTLQPELLQSQASQELPPLSVSHDNASISTGVDMNDLSRSLIVHSDGVGQVVTVTPRDGGPLSHLLPLEEIPSKTITTTSQESIEGVKDFERGQEDQLSITLVQKQEHVDPFIQDIDFEDNPYDHDFDSDVSEYDERYDGDRPHTQSYPTDQYPHIPSNFNNVNQQRSRPRSPLSDPENPPVDQDWDPDESYQTRFWNRIMDERRRRQEDLLLIEQQRQELNIERQQIAQIRSIIDQQKYDLEVRQNKMIEYESLIPSARELRNCGITLELILPDLSAINEKAVAENIDLKTAANNLVNDIQEYRQLGTLQNTIKHAKQQLSVLDTFNTQKQQAVTLMNLQLAGFSEKDINELIGLVTTWNKSGIGVPGFSQGNGRSSGFKLDDKLIG